MVEEANIMELSDYSFLERSVHEVYLWIWFVLHVWRCDRFSSLYWKRIISFDLKSYVTIFILFALPLKSLSDVIFTRIKYIEGLYMIPNLNDVVMAKPRWLWSEEDKSWFMPSYYLLMIGIGFQTITLFLLQCFWNSLTNSIAKTSFMSRWEFTIYIFWGFACVGAFPVLPFILKKNDILLVAIPQILYATQLLILVFLGIRTHVKFNGLIRITSSFKDSINIITKIRYFIDMNKLLTTSLAIMSAAFYLLGIDILTPNKIINNSKIASDILIAHANFAAIIEWLSLILIFYPRKGFIGTGAGGSSFNTNSGTIVNRSSQVSDIKLNNAPPGSGAGFSNNGINSSERRQISASIIDIDNESQFSNNNYSTSYNKSTQYNPNNNNNNFNNNYNNDNNSNNNNNSNNDNNNLIEIAKKPTLQKQSSIKKFIKKSTSQNNSASESDSINSDNGEGNTSISNLKRNISISRDGKMVYGETKPLGKVKGAEFVAVEKADPNSISNYYFPNNDAKDLSQVPSVSKKLGDDDDVIKRVNTDSIGSTHGITQGIVQNEIIVPQQGAILNNNAYVENADEYETGDDDEYFYAM